MIRGLVDTDDLPGSLQRIIDGYDSTREPIAQQLALIVQLLTGGGTAGITEAPTDDTLYGRKNGNWISVFPPAAWLSAALDGAWTGAIYCRMGVYGHAVQLYGTPSLVTGSLATGVWTRLAVLPNTMWPSVATAFLAPSQHANNTPDYAYVYVDTSGVISLMPSTNKVNQVLIDYTITLQ